jgi:hypothetical protein
MLVSFVISVIDGEAMGSPKVFVIIFTAFFAGALTQPYANDYSYDKYGFKREDAIGDSNESRYLKNNLRDRDGRLKANTDSGVSYNLDSNRNHHDTNQKKQGTSTDQLTHVQGENFETDKSHKRKHVKSGFTNSYHKDENGSRSSFYEDDDDAGGKTVFDKRHGTRGDNQEVQFSEGQRNGISRDRYDDRKSGYDNQDLVDQHRYRAEDMGMFSFESPHKSLLKKLLTGKQHGYADNYKDGLSDRYEIVRRPYSDLHNRQNFHHRQNFNTRHRDIDDYDRYNPSQHWVSITSVE